MLTTSGMGTPPFTIIPWREMPTTELRAAGFRASARVLRRKEGFEVVGTMEEGGSK